MITLALIGVGKWGQNYVKTIRKIEKVNLKYICASSEKNLKNFSDKYVKLSNYKDLLKYKDINGIIIATPSNTHYEIIKFFLSKGANLLIEKPLTTDFSQAEELGKIYQENKSIAMVAHIYLYNNAYLKFKELIGKIGKIKYLDFEGCDFGPFPKNTSALWEWAPHDVAMCLDLLSEVPHSVSAWSVGGDMIFARLKFKKTQAFMKFGWLSLEKRRKVVIIGSKSSIVFDDTKDKKVIFYEKTGSDKPQYPNYLHEEPLKTELKEFVDCLINNKESKTDLKNSSLVIKVIDAMQKSINDDGGIIWVK